MLMLIPHYNVEFTLAADHRDENHCPLKLRVSDNHLISFIEVLKMNGLESLFIEIDRRDNIIAQTEV